LIVKVRESVCGCGRTKVRVKGRESLTLYGLRVKVREMSKS